MKKALTVDDLIDLAVTFTVCLGILVVMILLTAFSLNNPDKALAFIGEFSVEKGAGIGGILLFLYLILKLVLKRRKKDGK